MTFPLSETRSHPIHLSITSMHTCLSYTYWYTLTRQIHCTISTGFHQRVMIDCSRSDGSEVFPACCRFSAASFPFLGHVTCAQQRKALEWLHRAASTQVGATSATGNKRLRLLAVDRALDTVSSEREWRLPVTRVDTRSKMTRFGGRVTSISATGWRRVQEENVKKGYLFI